MLDLLHKDFNSTVLNVLEELKKTIGKELKETRKMMYDQIENTNKKTEIIKETKQNQANEYGN